MVVKPNDSHQQQQKIILIKEIYERYIWKGNLELKVLGSLGLKKVSLKKCASVIYDCGAGFCC